MKRGLSKLRHYKMNQSECKSYYYDDIYLASIKRKPPILKSILLDIYGVFVCLWQKIIKWRVPDTKEEKIEIAKSRMEDGFYDRGSDTKEVFRFY